MRTTIDIDDALLAEAMEACGLKTKMGPWRKPCAGSYTSIDGRTPSPTWPGSAGTATSMRCGRAALIRKSEDSETDRSALISHPVPKGGRDVL